MARPLKGEAPLDQRLHLMLSEPEVQAIDDWRFANRVASRSEAIRRLIARGLAAEREDTQAGKASSPRNL